MGLIDFRRPTISEYCGTVTRSKGNQADSLIPIATRVVLPPKALGFPRDNAGRMCCSVAQSGAWL